VARGWGEAMADQPASGESTVVLERAARPAGSLVWLSTILPVPTTRPTELVDLTETVVRLTADSQVVDGKPSTGKRALLAAPRGYWALPRWWDDDRSARPGRSR
jgi:hypothetical protein